MEECDDAFATKLKIDERSNFPDWIRVPEAQTVGACGRCLRWFGIHLF